MKDVEACLELYRQRYETWRHLDNRRYQIIQLTVAAAAIVSVLPASSLAPSPVAVLALCSAVSLLLGIVLKQVNAAIRRNAQALRVFGQAIGDEFLPDVSNKSRSIFNFLEGSYFVAAGTSALSAIFLLVSSS